MADSQFINAVRKGMERKSISFRDLADKVGVTAGYLCHVLNGKRNPPSPDVIVEIAKALDIDPKELLTYAGVVPEYDRRVARIFRKISKLSEKELKEVNSRVDEIIKAHRLSKSKKK